MALTNDFSEYVVVLIDGDEHTDVFLVDASSNGRSSSFFGRARF